MSSNETIKDSQQSMLERDAACKLYEFACVLKSQESDLSEPFSQLQQALGELVSSERFMIVKRLFLLSSSEIKMLALVYLQEQDPDVIAPFLGLSWFEQGPMLSLDKLLTLVDTTLNKQQTMKQINLNSPLFEWGLLLLQNDVPALQRCVYLAPFLQHYFQLGQNNSEGLNYFTLVKPFTDPVFDVCGYPTITASDHSVVVLKGTDDNIPPWYVEQSAEKTNSMAALYSGEQLEHVDANHIIAEIACLQLISGGKPLLLYWANLSALPTPCLKKLKRLLSSCGAITLVTNTKEPVLDVFFNYVYVEQIIEPSLTQRALAWLSLCPNNDMTEQDKSQANQLAAKYPVELPLMKRLADKAKQQNANDYWQILQSLCFDAQSQHCDELAKLCQARYTLKDMMLQDKVAIELKELIARINLQTALQARLPRFNQGCKALFWGKPGTGKSMAAEVIAGELKLPLYMVNLANIASKWIGETEKHLAKLFDSAERNNAVLMFDEADAIFAKRSEVESSHDKNANMGVSYLLQRMEHYSGLLLLSTNFKSNLDEAFLRRFHGVIEFTLPTEQERVQIWTRHLNNNADANLQQGIIKLATLFELSAAQIINICEVALLQSLMRNKPQISRNDIANAIHRELSKQHAGFMAQQSLTHWLNGDKHGPHADI
ncbi:ATP-dependent zinc metalloprotease FtsH [Pseudoalteromonas holothuriae]|uniref:ATP-dependent zinc metalloprotease FtsH n=1 Tax=Pseudoalteromonas holothuriae TaxID=2963714 RepID=A0ABN8UMD8_9GAMM|nr:ATP-binding protein [Pseudoalteromonas sp. CIP111951]CAH9053853.1 ATP-dependent zinc metalloprotease FtsH [Pseudoalteromonas sp. CIP111951]